MLGLITKFLPQVSSIIDEMHTSGEEKAEMKLRLKSLTQVMDQEVEETIRTELQAKKDIIVAEMQQGDKLTKWARPGVVYTGLFVILLNHALIPFLASLGWADAGAIVSLPTEFWVAWSSVVGIWSVGRSAEKRGYTNKVVSAITGNKM